ncbi:MAG: hypothetical protein RQ715_10105 [Methylococcales bacterium]|nr:hypothetical protein [Methylococcales bacterium]
MTECFDYRLKRPFRGHYPGGHRSLSQGAGYDFSQTMPFQNAAERSRLALRETLLDPFQNLKVKVFRQPTRLDVYLMADCSASMACQGDFDPSQSLKTLYTAISRSALRQRDRFGFFAVNDRLIESLRLPATGAVGAIEVIGEKLNHTLLTGGAKAMAGIGRHIPSSSSLVFLVSDFHWPTTLLAACLDSLRQHRLVPVLLCDRKQMQGLSGYGLVTLYDPESHVRRLVWLSPKFKQRIRESYQARLTQLIAAFRRSGHEPLLLDTPYQAQAFNRYFLTHPL